jgi:hypothetical protein
MLTKQSSYVCSPRPKPDQSAQVQALEDPQGPDLVPAAVS